MITESGERSERVEGRSSLFHRRYSIFRSRSSRRSFSSLAWQFSAITYRDVNTNNYSLSLSANRDIIVIYKAALQAEPSWLSRRFNDSIYARIVRHLMDARILPPWRSYFFANYSVSRSTNTVVSASNALSSRRINTAVNEFTFPSWSNANWCIQLPWLNVSIR